MSWRDFLLRLRALLFRRQMDRELKEELQFHLEMQARKNEAQNLDLAEARRRARLEFGSIEQATEDCREARGVNFLETLWADIRYAFRMFGKWPSTTVVLILTLALGIGANTAVFTLINGLLLRSLPVDHPEQIVLFGSDSATGHTSTGTAPTGAVNLFSYHFFEQFRDRNNSGFHGITAMATPQNDVRVQKPDSGEPPRAIHRVVG